MFKIRNLDKFKLRLASFFLVSANILNLIAPIQVKAVDFSSQLSSNEALGSPLLNESTWEEGDWNRWETVAFGVFLSNFPVPFVDDYMTSFQDTGAGSNGYGLNALKYGSGNDSQANKVLTNLLSFAIKDQSQSLSNIKVRYHKIDNHFVDSLEGELKDDGADAKLKDLFIGIGDGGDTEPHIKRTTVDDSSFTQTFKYFSFDEMVLPEFYITTTNGPVQIFDYRDGYDIQMFSLNLARVANSIHKEKVMSNIDSLMESPIGFDVYGNICVQSDGKNIVVLPASANQHITNEKQYNLLTSTMMLGSYTSKSGDGLVGDFLSNKRGTLEGITSNGGGSLVYTSLDRDDLGKVIMYSDTDVALYQLAKSKVTVDKSFTDVIKEYVGDKDTFGFVTGEAIYELANADSIDNKIGLPFKVEVIGTEGDVTWTDKLLNGLSSASSTSSDKITNTVKASNFLANIYPTKPTNNILNNMFTLSGKATLFGESDKQYMGVGMRSGNGLRVYARYINYALKYLNTKVVRNISGTTSSNWGVPSQSDFVSRVRGAKDPKEAAQAIFSNVSPVTGDALGDSMPMNGLFKHWAVYESGYAKGKNYSDNKIANLKAQDTYSSGGLFFGNDFQNLTNIQGIGEMQDSFFRTAALYGFNSSAITASNVLNVVEGTEFASFTPYIYLSYLTFYGVVDGKSYFNPNIFTGDLLARKGEDIAKGAVLTAEAKKELMENYMFNLLDPESGAEYRKKLISNFMTEFLYDNYRKIVYGKTNNYIKSY